MNVHTIAMVLALRAVQGLALLVGGTEIILSTGHQHCSLQDNGVWNSNCSAADSVDHVSLMQITRESAVKTRTHRSKAKKHSKLKLHLSLHSVPAGLKAESLDSVADGLKPVSLKWSNALFLFGVSMVAICIAACVWRSDNTEEDAEQISRRSTPEASAIAEPAQPSSDARPSLSEECGLAVDETKFLVPLQVSSTSSVDVLTMASHKLLGMVVTSGSKLEVFMPDEDDQRRLSVQAPVVPGGYFSIFNSQGSLYAKFQNVSSSLTEVTIDGERVMTVEAECSTLQFTVCSASGNKLARAFVNTEDFGGDRLEVQTFADADSVLILLVLLAPSHFAHSALPNGPYHEVALPLFSGLSTQTGSADPALESQEESIADHALYILRADVLRGPGWPQFWLMTFAGGLSEGLCLLLLPDVGYAAMNGGRDPCETKHFNQAQCDKATVSFAKAIACAVFLNIFSAFWAAPVVAKLCDELGRRPIIIARAILTKIHTVVLFCVWAYGVSIFWFFCSYAILGLIPKTAVWNLWVADRVDVRNRTVFFAVLQYTSCCFILVVPVVILLGNHGSSLIVSSLSGLLCVLLSIFTIPESLTPERRRQMQTDGERHLSTSYMDGVRVATGSEKMRMICLLVLVGSIIGWGLISIWLPWLKEKYGAYDKDVAPLIFVMALCELLVTLFLVKPMTANLGLKKLVLISWLMAMVAAVIHIGAPSFRWLYLAAPFVAIAGVSGPAVGAWFLNTSKPAQLAQVQAVYSQMGSVSAAVGPFIFSGCYTFALSSSWLKNDRFLQDNSPFLLALVMSLAAVTILMRLPPGAFPANDKDVDPCEVAPAKP
jgi:MFS family permease